MPEMMAGVDVAFSLVYRSAELVGDGFQEVFGVHVHGFVDIGRAVDAYRQIFCHLTRFDRIDACFFQCQGEVLQFGCAIEFCAMRQSS